MACRWGISATIPKRSPRFTPAAAMKAFCCFDRKGNILKHVRVGHARAPASAKYRPDLPGLQYMTSISGGTRASSRSSIRRQYADSGGTHPYRQPVAAGQLAGRRTGVCPVFGKHSRRRHDRWPPAPSGHVPGRWSSRSCRLHRRSHGRPRDEIILWDQERVWIYTQDRPFTGKRIYAPVRNPHYNDSNYRANVSLPRWVN